MATNSDMTSAKLGTYSDHSLFEPYRTEIIYLLSSNLTPDIIQHIRFLNGFLVENTSDREFGPKEATMFVSELNSRKLLSLSHLKSQLRHFEQMKLLNQLDEICSRLSPSDLALDIEYAREEIPQRLARTSTGFLLRNPAARIAVVNTFRDGLPNFAEFKVRFSPPLSPAEIAQCSLVIKLLQLLDTQQALLWNQFLAALDAASCLNAAQNLRKNFRKHRIPFEEATGVVAAAGEIEGSVLKIGAFLVPNAERCGERPWKDDKYNPIGAYSNGKPLEAVRVDLIKILANEVLPNLQAPLCFLYQIDLAPLTDENSFEEKSVKFLAQLSSRRELCITLLIEILVCLEEVSIASKLQSVLNQLSLETQELDREYSSCVKLKLSSKKMGNRLRHLRYRLCLARTFKDLPLQEVQDIGRVYSQTGSPPKFPPVKLEQLRDVFKLFDCVDSEENRLDWIELKDIVHSLDALSLYGRKLKKCASELNCLELL